MSDATPAARDDRDGAARASCGAVLDPGFVPARGLASPHLQTLWAAYRRPVPQPACTLEVFPTADGDVTRVARWTPLAGEGRPLVLLLHGLNGSHRSRYMRGMAATLIAAGYEVHALEFRGVDGGPMRGPRSYHAGFTEDLASYARHLHRAKPARALAAIGFSLGGNVLLRWLAETGEDAPLAWAAAVSVPYDLAACARTLHRGRGRAYEAVLLRELCRNTARRVRRYGHPRLSAHGVLRCRSIVEFDDLYVAPLFGFRDAEDYYERMSSGRILKDIEVPTLLVQSEDDPLVPASILPGAEDLAPDTILLRARAGGHVGFIEDGDRGRRSWCDGVILDALTRHVPVGRGSRPVAGA